MPTIYLYVGTDGKIREYGKRVVRTGALIIDRNYVSQPEVRGAHIGFRSH